MVDLPVNRFPLIVGVTGHRDLRDEDLPRLEQEVVRIFATLKRDYLGKDGQTPILVLSALAEGADQLVARVALSQGARLIAPLPMQLEEYRRDFAPGLRPDALEEFDRLLAQAIAAPIVALAAGNTFAAIRSNRASREEQYRKVGLFIVRYCHVLIALWDGADKEGAAGGTAEVVAFKRYGIPIGIGGSARSALDAPEIGPVIQVIAPRAGKKAMQATVSVRPWGRAFVQHIAMPRDRVPSSPPSTFPSPEEREAEAWTSFEALTKLSCRFNREAAGLDATPDAELSLEQAFANYRPECPVDTASARTRAVEAAPRWCSLYGIADALALARQRQFRNIWRILFLVGLTALLIFDVETHLLPDVHGIEWLLVAYGAALAVAFICFIHARRREYQERFLDYRALAEALRVAMFWKLIGLGGPHGSGGKADSIADAYPIKQPSELAWVKTCLRTVELLDVAAAPGERQILDEKGYGCARELWVGGQLAYFAHMGHSHHETAEARERLSLGLMLFAIVLACVLFLLSFRFELHHENWRHRILIFAIGVLPGIAAVWVGYTEQLALKAQARQYDRMRTLFERAYELLPDKLSDTTPADAQAIYAELGGEAMKEHAEWVAIYRQRPIRPPQG
jgi:hypothetical protein